MKTPFASAPRLRFLVPVLLLSATGFTVAATLEPAAERVATADRTGRVGTANLAGMGAFITALEFVADHGPAALAANHGTTRVAAMTAIASRGVTAPPAIGADVLSEPAKAILHRIAEVQRGLEVGRDIAAPRIERSRANVAATTPQPQTAGGELDVDVTNGNSPHAVTADDTWQYVDVGETSTGVINHTAGTFTVTDTLTLGNQTGSNGTYNLSGTGAVVTVFEFIGNNGAGAFIQNGGTNTVSNLLALGSAGGASTYTLTAGVLAINSGTATGAMEYIGQFGAATFTQAGGTHTVNPTGTFFLGYDSAGTYNLNGGTLTVPAVAQNTSTGGTGTFNFNGGILQANAASTTFLAGLTGGTNVLAGGAKIDSNGFAITIPQALIHSAALGATPDGGLTKLGLGTLTLTGTNTYTGVTTFAGGVLNVGSAIALGPASSLSFTGGTLQYSSANTTDYSSRFSTAASQAYSVDTNSFAVTFASALTSTGGSFTKLGLGTLTLTAADTYSGATTVSAGILTVNNNATTLTGRLPNTSGVTIGNGGTLTLAGSVAVTDRINNGATVLLNGGGTIATGALNEGTAPTAVGVGGTVGVGALTLSATTSALRATIDFGSTQTGSTLVSSSLVASGKGAFVSVLDFTGAARTDSGVATNDRLLFTSDPGFTVADLANWQFSNDAGALFATGGLEIPYNGYFEIVPVPEPSTWLGGALLLGAAGAALRRRPRAA